MIWVFFLGFSGMFGAAQIRKIIEPSKKIIVPFLNCFIFLTFSHTVANAQLNKLIFFRVGSGYSDYIVMSVFIISHGQTTTGQ